MNQMPVKYRVAQVIFQNEGISDQELLERLQSEYPLDRSVTEKGIGDYLLSLNAVGLIELTSVTFNNNKLKQCYKITDYGADRMKYIN